MNDKKVALITGANKGIGFEIARQLGKQGIIVLMCARDEHLGRQAANTLHGEGIDARPLILDVTRKDQIDAAAAEVDRQFGTLDILVNNAGILVERCSPSGSQLESIRKTFETNFFAAFAVTKAFLPLLHKSQAGRIVNVSSALGSMTRAAELESPPANFLAYNASKAALNMMTIAFAKELRGTCIKVNAAAPGYTATAMNNFTGYKTTEQAAIVPVRLASLPADGPTGGFFDENGPVPW